jgi:hypothetical protein
MIRCVISVEAVSRSDSWPTPAASVSFWASCVATPASPPSPPRRLLAIVCGLIDRQHLHVLQQHIDIVASLSFVRVSDIDTIAGQYEAGNAEHVIDADRNGFHALLKHSGKCCALAGAGDLPPKDGFIGSIDV